MAEVRLDADPAIIDTYSFVVKNGGDGDFPDLMFEIDDGTSRTTIEFTSKTAIEKFVTEFLRGVAAFDELDARIRASRP